MTGAGRIQTAMDMSTMAMGHATALANSPNAVAPREVGSTLEASPTTLMARPVASRIHGSFRLPESTAKPPAINPRSRASPIG